MEKNARIPFPQADDFEKIIAILNVNDEQLLTNKSYIKSLLLGIADRQIGYYFSACIYLGLIDENRSFSPLGRKLRKLSSREQEIELLRLILSDAIFGRCILSELANKFEMDYDDITGIIKDGGYTKYSPAIYRRRSQTVKSWSKWAKSILSSN